MRRTAVIGAGAAGMMAAIAASEDSRVTLFDKNEIMGRKLLQTGNGKCNFLNVSLSEDNYRGSLISEGIFKAVREKYPEDFILDLFSSFGLLYHIKNKGYYPRSDTSASVNDILINELRQRKVDFHPSTLVKNIEREGDHFILTLMHLKSNKKGRDEEKYDAVVIATGGMAAPKTGSTGDAYYFARNFGLKVEEALPGLTRLLSPDIFFNETCVRSEVSLKLLIDNEYAGSSEGEMQVTDSGPSGICVFDLSGRAAKALRSGKKCVLSVDLLPEYSEEQVFKLLGRHSGPDNEKTLDIFTGIFSERLSLCIDNKMRKELFPDREHPLIPEIRDLKQIASFIKNLRFEIEGTGDFNSAQVTVGGILGESLTTDLSARDVPGLYFAGECLDIDGDCGGYNLYWAFSSGYAAGKAASQTDAEGSAFYDQDK